METFVFSLIDFRRTFRSLFSRCRVLKPFTMFLKESVEVVGTVDHQNALETAMVRCRRITGRVEKFARSFHGEMKHGPMRSRFRTRVGVYDKGLWSLFNVGCQFVGATHFNGLFLQNVLQFNVVHCNNTLLEWSTCMILGNIPYMSTVTLFGRGVPNLSSNLQSLRV